MNTVPPPAPCAPKLEPASEGSIRVRYVAPPGCPLVQVQVRSAGGEWQNFDRHTAMLCLPSSPWVACAASAGQCTVPGLRFDKFYAVRCMAQNSAGSSSTWSPTTSLRIATHLPPRPYCPTLEPVSCDSMRIRYAAPPCCSHIKVQLRPAEGQWKSYNSTTGKLVQDRPDLLGCPSNSFECTIQQLDPKTRYEVRLKAKNSVGWSQEWSSVQRLTIANQLPVSPCAPTLEAKSPDSIRVRYAAPPDCSFLRVFVRQAGGKWTVFDCRTKTLIPLPATRVRSCKASANECTISGLQPQTTYEVRCKAKNSIGWGAGWSPRAKLTLGASAPDGDQVEVVGASSWAERDSALRKQAVELDDDEHEDNAAAVRAALTSNGSSSAESAKRNREVIDVETMGEQPKTKRRRPTSREAELRRLS